jgi:predicted amidophosphoribosyltransferase
MIKRCTKCGEPLEKTDEKYCVYCKKDVTPQEQQDIDNWKKREKDDW